MTLGANNAATLVAFGAAALIVATLTPIAIRLLQERGVVDTPNARSSHSHPTPRGAGIVTGLALTIGFAIGWNRLTLALALVAMLSTTLGSIEDIRGTRIAVRLGAQTTLGIAFVATTWTSGQPLVWLAGAGSVLFIVAYTNAFNFMDGINGISAATAAVSGLTLVALAHAGGAPDLELVGAVLTGTAVFFLPFNFPRAKVFLGDAGSYSFGAAIACSAVAAWRSGIRADALICLVAIYVADTSSVVVRRAIRSEPLTSPHREHVYQRLVQRGGSHAQVTGIVLAFTAATAGLGIALLHAQLPARIFFDSAALLVVVTYLALPRLLRPAHRN